MDKRYQVFVSSTFTDLQEERQAVMQALLSLDHFPAGMELFPASDDDQWALIKGVIDDSDYYVLVIGGRYGTTSDAGVSYTEMEYDHAVAQRKPVLAFVHAKPEEIPSGKTDQDDKLRERLNSFKKKVGTNKHIKFWKNPDDLKATVIQSISAETKRNPQVGWVRADRAADPSVLEGMRQEVDRLNAQLSSVSTSAPKNTEKYAQGTAEFAVTLYYELPTSFTKYPAQFLFEWNNLFFELGPILMEEASETQMKARLAQELIRYEQVNFPEDAQLFIISDDTFDTIKIQLMALGLITKSSRKHAPTDRERYWTLTPYGENELMKLRAITV
ncbi:DUF4062 domain-containing protein [Bradyrhizobium sp. URHD0069]|uniref:DUF4062 domain-containing protein n=1 Tax=Bradyrhizobium sp. URHD0069 TaxID=1380355 RepID=UPI00049803AB|nr:DUF4062 domain-containing protein [Bradyrhizobium sp. URHD0069]